MQEMTARPIPLSKIVRREDQPREVFDEEGLIELAESIKEQGLQSPIKVRPMNGTGTFEIVMGERRWRAHQKLGATEILAFVEEMDDERAYIVALMENINRRDLNAIEEGRAYAHCMRMGMDADRISSTFGKAKNYITWRMSLLDLREDLQHLVARQQMTPYIGFLLAKLSHNGQARALRQMNAEPMTMQSVAAMCNTIWAEENTAEMFDQEEVGIGEEAQKAGRAAKDFLGLAGSAAKQLGDYDDETIGHGLISEVGAEDKAREIMRVLQRIIGIERRRRGAEAIRQEVAA